MSTYVLVHGMWHGGWCWRRVSPGLRYSGHAVYAPTLTGLGERSHLRSLAERPAGGQAGLRAGPIDLHVHIRDVVNVLEFEDLREVVLVGHSLGGTLAQAVAEEVPERLAHVVNIDGPRAVDGKAIKDLLPELWAEFQERAKAEGDPAWVSPPRDWTFGVEDYADQQWLRSKLTPHPLATWETLIRLRNPAAERIPRTYVVCTGGETPEAIAAHKKTWHAPGWQLETLATGHDPMITAPHELVELLRVLG